MTVSKIQIRPGFNTQLSQTANESGWFNGNLVRWKGGLLEKVGGWRRLFNAEAAGVIRALHSYLDLYNESNLIIAGDGGVQIYDILLFNTLSFTVGTAGSLSYTTVVSNSTVDVVTGIQGLVAGQTIQLLMHQSIGGILWPSGQTFTIATVVNSTTGEITFNMVTLATTVGGQGTPSFLFDKSVVPTVTVTYKRHGLSPGGTFTPSQTTIVNQVPSAFGQLIAFQLPAGTNVLVATTPTVDTFTFDATPYLFGSISLASNITVLEGATLIGGSGTTFGQALSIGQVTITPPPSDWFLDNLGNNGLINYTGGPIYVYTPPATSPTFLINAGVSGTPQQNNGMFVAMPQAQVIVFGTNPVLGFPGQDPLLLRWSDAGSYTSWTATVSNQAGSYRLSRGSRIVGGIQAPQTTLIWTDIDLWSMSYIGPPLVYGFTIMGASCGLVSAKARATLGRTTYWIGQNSFWTFGDTGVQPLASPVWDQFFNNLNQGNIGKCFAGANSSFHEVWFFYPSLSGTPSWNQNKQGPVLATLTNSNQIITAANAHFGQALGQGSKSSGKWYAEATLSASTVLGVNGFGLGKANTDLTSFPGFDIYSWGFYPGGLQHNNVLTAAGVVPAQGDIMQIAVDLDAGYLWFGLNNTWILSGDPANGINPTYTSVSGQVFLDTIVDGTHGLPLGQFTFAPQIFTAPSGFSWWGAGECDSYVKFNALENLWDFGSLIRSTWLDNNIFGPPLAGDRLYLVQQHESGYDDDGSAMSGVFAESGYSEVSSGDQIMFMDQMIPDFKWFGNSAGSITIELDVTNYPGDAGTTTSPLTITPTTEYLPMRSRARQIAMRLDWSATAGYSARVEAIRFRVAPAGRRP